MPRGPRPVVPWIPHHVTHRGNNRGLIFINPDDYQFYLACLKWAKTLYRCRIYAYVLMTNHVHLLLDPAHVAHLGSSMKRVAGRYTRYMNKRYGRTGTLWEGRFRSALVERERYLLAACRYIEMNPVRAGIVMHPREYPWSSYLIHAEGKTNSLVDCDPWYESLGIDAHTRGRAYETWLEESIPKGEWDSIRMAIRRSGWAGSEQFGKQIAVILGRVVENRPPGRPKHTAKINLSPFFK